MTYDVATIGEGQLRLTVHHGQRLTNATGLRACAAGSEANVAALLSQLGRSTAWTTVLPEGDLGDRILAEYRSAGVDVSLAQRTPHGRVALYFLEPAAGGNPAQVTFDRLHTPFRDLSVTDLDWDRMLDTRVLFLTGITAALSESTAEVVIETARRAHAAGITVALDINHRPALWTASDAADTLGRVLPFVRILFCSRRDAGTVFGIMGDGLDVVSTLQGMSGAQQVISTDGGDAVYWADGDQRGSAPVAPVSVVDRPGAGDALVAGVLHGLLDGALGEGIRAGVRFASIALTHYGDITRVSARDLESSDTADIRR